MYKVFFDTNAFDRMKLDFDVNNHLIRRLCDFYNDKQAIFILISIFKNEIMSHIEKHTLESVDKIKAIVKEAKWLDIINYDELYKRKSDGIAQFLNFIKICGIEEVDVDDVSPEIVFKKYFNIEAPFESVKGKKNEFPDAFAVEKMKKIIDENMSNDKDDYILVTSDNGMKKSMADYPIKVVENIPMLVELLSNLKPDIILKIKNYFTSSVCEDIFLESDLLKQVKSTFKEFNVFFTSSSLVYIHVVDYDIDKKEYLVFLFAGCKFVGDFNRGVNESDEIFHTFEIPLSSIYVHVKFKNNIIRMGDIEYMWDCDSTIDDICSLGIFIEQYKEQM